MIIQSDKGFHGFFVLLQCCVFWLCYCLLQVDAIGRYEGVVLFVLFVVLEIALCCFWIRLGRVLIMDKDGCTICFLFIRKKYRWDELQTKHLEKFRARPYTEGIVFSKNVIRNPGKTLDNGMVFTHPFRDFLVCFEPVTPDYLQKSNSHIRVYEVNKSEFLAKLNEWGQEVIRDF